MVLELEGGWFGGENCPVIGRHRGRLVVIDFLGAGCRWTVVRNEFGVARMEAVA